MRTTLLSGLFIYLSAMPLFADTAIEIADRLYSEERHSEGYEHLSKALEEPSNEAQLAELVTRGILEVDGILSSETLVAFRSFSKFDLAELFDVGSESARN